MNKIRYILLFFLTLPIVGFTQEDIIKSEEVVEISASTIFKNEVDLDIHLLGIEGTYKRRVSKRAFVGGSIGFGVMGRYSILGDWFVDFGRVKLLFDYFVTKKFHLHFGTTISTGLGESDDWSHVPLGLEVGAFYRIWKLELGVEPALIYFDKQASLTTSFLIIRIPLSRW